MSKKAYDLYLVDALDLDEAREIVEKRLGVTLMEHESSYKGGQYFRLGDVGGENLILQRNFDPEENAPFESRFPHARFLLYLSETERGDVVLQKLSVDNRCTRLRHELL